MKITRARLVQIISVFVVHVITLFILQKWMEGFNADGLASLAVFSIALGAAQAAFWWAFIYVFSWLPGWLYPILTFVLNGLLVMVVGNLIKGTLIGGNGIYIANVVTGIWISLWLTAVDAMTSGLLSLDNDSQFDRRVTRRMVNAR